MDNSALLATLTAELNKRNGKKKPVANFGSLQELATNYVPPSVAKRQQPQPDTGGFNNVMQNIRQVEGGYSNNPNDKGGETNFGISKRSYPNLDIKNLNREQADSIYMNDYYKKSHIDAMPQQLQSSVMDSVVNHGNYGGTKLLQKAINDAGGNVAVDGKIGNQTLSAMSFLDPTKLNDALMARRQGKYANIIKNDPSQAAFANGWNNRLAAQRPIPAKNSNITDIVGKILGQKQAQSTAQEAGDMYGQPTDMATNQPQGQPATLQGTPQDATNAPQQAEPSTWDKIKAGLKDTARLMAYPLSQEIYRNGGWDNLANAIEPLQQARLKQLGYGNPDETANSDFGKVGADEKAGFLTAEQANMARQALASKANGRDDYLKALAATGDKDAIAALYGYKPTGDNANLNFGNIVGNQAIAENAQTTINATNAKTKAGTALTTANTGLVGAKTASIPQELAIKQQVADNKTTAGGVYQATLDAGGTEQQALAAANQFSASTAKPVRESAKDGADRIASQQELMDMGSDIAATKKLQQVIVDNPQINLGDLAKGGDAIVKFGGKTTTARAARNEFLRLVKQLAIKDARKLAPVSDTDMENLQTIANGGAVSSAEISASLERFQQGFANATLYADSYYGNKIPIARTHFINAYSALPNDKKQDYFNARSPDEQKKYFKPQEQKGQPTKYDDNFFKNAGY
jgi:lysozyme family protein